MRAAFWICAVLAVIGALGMIFSKKAVHSALWVANTMINLAVLYALLDAQFLSMVQIIVYTGAVMMLFLFVLMIVGVDASDSLVETIKGQRIVAILVALALGGTMISAIASSADGAVGLEAANDQWGGNMQGLAALIFGRYILAFEVTSALLITAAMGAMVLAHLEHFKKPSSQRDLSVARFKGDGHKGSLPAPGTYARHNAVDTPALLPDGSMAENSVPKPLAARGALRQLDANEAASVKAIDAGEAVVTNPGSES